MTPEGMAGLVARWVRFYTRNLPTPIAERRKDEIAADLHDHIAEERGDGTSERRIALSILSRMLRGLPADAAWRRRHAQVRRSSIGILLATASLLLVPLLAMQFTDEVVWTPGDFVFAGVLLAGAGLLFRGAWRKAGNGSYRVAAGVAVGSALLLVWTVAAVGVIGEDGDPADLMYGGVVAVGIGGALVARFRPQGMARALLAMTLAQGLVAVIALIAGKHHEAVSSAFEIVAVNAFFAALFIGSAWLFRHSARKERAANPSTY